MSTRLISITPDVERTIIYIARVTSEHQDNPEGAKLIKYLIDHNHYSPFEHGHATFEIITSRAIAAQLLRHRSMVFQEFSLRYSSNIDLPTVVVGRKQSTKNRQSSTEELSEKAQEAWLATQERVYKVCYDAYDKAITLGVAKEQARLLLPLNTPTKLYMTGNVRSWIHYCELRCKEDTQLEHRRIAGGIKSILIEQLPVITKALEWY